MPSTSSAAELAFVAAARSFVGTGATWRHRGRKPWAMDCVGLPILAARKAGLPIEDVKGYGREPWDDQLRKTLRQRYGAPIAPAQWCPGLIAVIRWGAGEPSHIGILGDHPDGLSLIHMHNLHGAIEQALTGAVRSSVLECYRPWRA